MSVSNKEFAKMYGPQILHGLCFGVERRAITANLTLSQDSPTIQNIDPDQARTVNLPAVKRGLTFIILHGSTGNFDLTISSPVALDGSAGATTRGTISQSQIGIAVSDGVTWFVGMLPQT